MIIIWTGGVHRDCSMEGVVPNTGVTTHPSILVEL